MDSWNKDGEVVQYINPSNASLQVLLLHGNLDIWVKEAKNLPNLDQVHSTLGTMFGNFGLGKNLKGGLSEKATSDPYVTISVSNAVIGRTFVIDNNENPVWQQHFYLPVAHYCSEVHFVVKDDDVVGSEVIGVVGIPTEKLFSGLKVEGTFPIIASNGKPCKAGAVLTLSIQYFHVDKVFLYHDGVGSHTDNNGVPATYFPLRRGGKVTLYQDAHVPDECQHKIMLDNDKIYNHGNCWIDVFEAISQARRFIYITGWSVYHMVQLVRYGPNAERSSLGDLLKAKSQEGLRVLLLVWDDPTSSTIVGYKKEGLMGTNDEETRRFFKHSSVQVLLCPRSSGKGHSWVKKQEAGTIYTHHQKTVILDADAGNFRRKIVAFVGGLDLCKGRYDTPVHDIFRTLETVHKDDYHNPNYVGPTSGCPREPWHDLHSRIDGPAAYDVLKNFEERWTKASKVSTGKKNADDSLLKIDRIGDILGIADYVRDDDPESWNVQVFRSIDSNSVKGFPKDPREATSRNLICGKNILIDMSIHAAYVKAIRSAHHFIYIENQYFIGSSFNWKEHKTLGANNLIPMEIALKIAEKIRAHERFAAYIVVPMWPEGVPTSAPTQRILYWQSNTMQMMYEVIYKALKEEGLESSHKPQDYLNFFCLGNREADLYNGDAGAAKLPQPQVLSKIKRRFMIYVHSKGMIVDDEYVIIGSANINQRSMEGTRDTEIAMGAYQPRHTWYSKQGSPRGQVYGYRMSLWGEHVGEIEECFKQPESIECVRRLRSIGEQNWTLFADDVAVEMRSHLLKYPVEVDPTGKVRPLTGCEFFPDLGGRIVGNLGPIGIQENLTI